MEEEMAENKENNKNDLNELTSKDSMEKVMTFIKKNIRYFAAAGIFLILVIVLVRFTGPSTNNTAEPTEIAETETQSNEYKVDAYPEINEVISNYYNAFADGDIESLEKIATPITDTEKSYISVFSEYIDKYQNISCYTKQGLDKDSYIVSVYIEIKFKDVETVAPGLDFFYVKPNEDGELYIDNLYSQFNMSNQEQALDPDISNLIEEFEAQEDVIRLQEDVQAKYMEAVDSDENLKNLVANTIPDAISKWASEQAEAAKKAEEEAAAAEEAKKAEEEAKKAEEEAAKKAAEEAANRETVYATDKVNVRASASQEAEVIGQLENGQQTSRLESTEDGWSKIDYSEGVTGYVKSEFLSTEAPAAPAAEAEAPAPSGTLAEGSTITLKESTNIRESMDETSAKVATGFSGEKVTVIMSYAEGWTKVTYGDKTGYIKTELLQ